MTNQSVEYETASPLSLVSARVYIESLDLNYIIEFMCSQRYPLPRWNLPDAAHCCQLYKNFLILLKKHDSEFLVPTREIDEFWHNHILYTRNYYFDSMVIFGRYLHHDPASPNDDPEFLAKHYLKTKQYYLEEFKQALETAY
jgi:hypothetical protein